jgi:hypothetical protein
VVANGHWLPTLQVCVSWKDCFGVMACLFEQRILKPTKKSKEVINSVPTIEASVGRNLIISGTCGVKLSPSCPDLFGESCLDIHMDVFVFDRELKVAFCNLALDFAKSLFDLGEFVLGQDSSFNLGSGVGD